MDVKEQTRKAYELFGKGDMETFFNEMIDDNIVSVSYTHLTLPTKA